MSRDPDLARRLAAWIPSLAFAPAPRGPGSPPLRPRASARVTIEHASDLVDPFADPHARREAAPLPVIALARDLAETPTSCHHVLRELAATRRVLWIEALSTRPPAPAPSGPALLRALRAAGAAVASPLERAVHVERDLWVARPQALPAAGPLRGALGERANLLLARATLHALRRQLAIDAFELWTFLPTTADLVARVGAARTVYYCSDDWTLFPHLPRPAIAAAERAQLARVDAVFAVSHALADRKRVHQPRTFVAPHGVEHALFATALDDATPVPAEVAALPGPRIGVIGALREWVDVDLIAALARARPAWSLVLIGPVLRDVAAMRALPNVHLLGARPHAALPAYCKALDAGLIPYADGPRQACASPLALRELLAAGVPVVATDIAEARRYATGAAPLCRVARGVDDVAAALAQAITEAGPVARGARSAAMKHETWTARVHDLDRALAALPLDRTLTRRLPPR